MSIKVKKKIEDNICFKEDDLKKKMIRRCIFENFKRHYNFFLQIYNCEES